jgi:hypothetical protein
MKWTEVFKLVFAMVASVGGAGAIIFILSSWLGKVWAHRILAREQAELHRLAKQHEIRFTELHVERAHVIKGLYEKLVDLYDSMQSLLKYFQGGGEPSLDEKAQVFRDAHNEFIRAVARNKIYFAKDTCEIMDRLCFTSRDTYIDITTYPIDPRHPELHVVKGLYQERTEMWEKAREAFKKDIISLKERLEEEFRSLLGVEH